MNTASLYWKTVSVVSAPSVSPVDTIGSWAWTMISAWATAPGYAWRPIAQNSSPGSAVPSAPTAAVW